MNRRALEKHLAANGCILHHHGRRHDVWANPETGARGPVPRHEEVKYPTARSTCKMLGISPPPGR